MVYYSLDESAKLQFVNRFYEKDLAVEAAHAVAQQLGRAINVFEIVDGRDKYPAFHVLPDGSVVDGPSPTNDNSPNEKEIVPVSPAVLGEVLDEIAECLEVRGASDLADEVDALRSTLVDSDVSMVKDAVNTAPVFDKLPVRLQKMLEYIRDIENEGTSIKKFYDNWVKSSDKGTVEDLLKRAQNQVMLLRMTQPKNVALANPYYNSDDLVKLADKLGEARFTPIKGQNIVHLDRGLSVLAKLLL